MTLLTINEATKWASSYLKKEVFPSNISYLIQYGKVKRYGENGSARINVDELKRYYSSYKDQRELSWKKKLGNDLNWNLSFDHLREKDTTKHVHRLHPYKGKFIPQLVEYFIDDHTDEFKTKSFFKRGDIILDPFLGSGTTVVQSLEMGIHGIGIDISEFNCTISRCKVATYNEESLKETIQKLCIEIDDYEESNKIQEFEEKLLHELAKFNVRHFPNPDFKYKVNQREIDEAGHALEKERQFLPIYKELIRKYRIKLFQEKPNSFLDKWYIANVRKEIDLIFDVIKKERDPKVKQLLAVILSRTIRSCRATTHSDLATLKEPQVNTYYCYKHKKMCKPLFSIKKILNRYALDTVKRVDEFKDLRSNSYYSIIAGDSREVDILKRVKKQNSEFYPLLKKNKIKGIFSSPPYVGQIDYHEQHAYAYDLLGYTRKDELEIGPLYKGKGIEARRSYVKGISNVLNNCKRYLVKDYDIFLVANDKYNLYPEIAEKSQMRIVNQFKRPVLNRTERDRNPYSEIIFHMKEK